MKDISTHKRGDIALGKVISDLLEKGWYVFVPVSTHACHYDLIASKNDNGKDIVLRVQVKLNHTGHRKYYDIDNPFDLYACYYEQYNRVVYISFEAAKNSCNKSFKIKHEIPNSATPFFWWEDFSEINQKKRMPKKRTAKRLGHKIKLPTTKGLRASKVNLTDYDLQKLLWKKSLVVLANEIGVSDRALGKRVTKLGLIKPPSGYWCNSAAKRKATRLRYKDIVREKLKELKDQ